jgi:hypothetical protein
VAASKHEGSLIKELGGSGKVFWGGAWVSTDWLYVDPSERLYTRACIILRDMHDAVVLKSTNAIGGNVAPKRVWMLVRDFIEWVSSIGYPL